MAYATQLTGLSSMATRTVLAELAQMYRERGGTPITIESVGGVDAARRVQAGEVFDAVFLASDAIDKLVASGHVRSGSRVDLMRSEVSVAVRAGTPVPDMASEAALRGAVLAAPSIGFSTGPSGVALRALFERWGILGTLQDRIVQAPTGVPVGQLVADGRVALDFQQTSELLHLPGISIVGSMPRGAEILTIFSAGVCATCSNPQATMELLTFFASTQALDAKRRQGMDSCHPTH